MKKRGKLSESDISFIEEYSSEKSIDEIAEYLGRTVETIKKHIDKLGLATSAMSNEERELLEVRQRLYSREYYAEIKRQFTDRELRYFEALWIKLIRQFREDVLPTEELQIKQLITTEILINRCMEERKRCLEDIQRLAETLDAEYTLPLGDRNIDRIMNLEQQLGMSRGSQTAYTNEYTKLSKESKDLSKDLKATRDQRLKRVEDGKSSWVGLIRMLEDEVVREREGRGMSLMKSAADNSIERLAEYHTYQDKQLDIPILTPEIVLKKEQEDE